jgi:hypothetical protein
MLGAVGNLHKEGIAEISDRYADGLQLFIGGLQGAKEGYSQGKAKGFS